MSNQSPVPILEPQVPIRYGKAWQAIGRYAVKLTGWRMEGNLPNLPKFIAVGGPHTVLSDTALSLMFIFAMGLDARIMIKKEVFDWFLVGRLLKRFGSIPVDRQSPKDIIEQMVAYVEKDNFVLCIAPEGTRKVVPRLKTGFYRIATAANVPIQPISIDRKQKLVTVHDLIYPTGDIDNEVAGIKAIFDEVRARQS